jgi:hypothetical protein
MLTLGGGALMGLLLAGGAPVNAGVADDDLQVVKRAVQSKAAAATQQAPAPAVAGDEKPAPKTAGAAPQWLRVRVSERNGKRVRINLPLALVRAVGDWPIDFGCHRHRGEDRRCTTLRLSEVLDALDKGESLVEIDDGGTTVRVWVE